MKYNKENKENIKLYNLLICINIHWNDALILKLNKGAVIIYGGEWVAPKRNVFLGKNCADPTIKNKYMYPPLAKNFTTRYHSVVTHVLYHFCVTSLGTACAIFCSLKLHVVCTCTVFRDTICLLTNRKMIKILTLIDLYRLHCCCCHCFLAINI